VDPRDDRILNTSTNLGCGDGSLHVGDGSLDDGCVLVILLCVSLTIFCLLPLATLVVVALCCVSRVWEKEKRRAILTTDSLPGELRERSDQLAILRGEKRG